MITLKSKTVVRILPLLVLSVTEAVACTVKMKDLPLEGDCEATVLAGDSPDSFNDIEHPDRVVPRRMTLVFTKGVGNLPPHSLTIVKARLKQ